MTEVHYLGSAIMNAKVKNDSNKNYKQSHGKQKPGTK